MKKTAAGNMTNSKQTQQRIEGDFGALFVAAKGRRMKSAPHAPRPVLLILCFPTCRLACCAEQTLRQIHEFSDLIFVCKTECAQKKIEKIAAEFGREP